MLKAALSMRSLDVVLAVIVALIAWRAYRYFRPKRRTITLPNGRNSPLIDAKPGTFFSGMMATIILVATLVIVAIVGGMFAEIGIAIEIIGLLLLFGPIIAALVAIGLVRRGYMENPVFEIETGNIGYVDSGSSNWRMYSNVPGMKLEYGVTFEDRELGIDPVVINGFALVPGDNNDELSYFGVILKKYWGVYWRGLGIMNRSVHLIPITKKYVNADLRANLDPKYWVTGTKDGSDETRNSAKFPVVPVDGLRWKFPRPVAIPDVKFSGGVEAQMLALVNFRTVIPMIPVYTLKGDFMSVLESVALTAMKDVLALMTSQDFKGKSQVEGSPMTLDAIRRVNKRLLIMCGIIIEGISIPIYNLSSEEEERLTKAEELANLRGRAALTEQDWANKKALSKAETDAKVVALIAAASIKDAADLADHYLGMGADANVAATEATSLGRARRYTTPGSPVTTQVEGGGAAVAIQPTTAPRIEITDRQAPPLKDKRRK